ncbi:MAG: T9SS type A sorting domain-containing protein [Ignavibacteriaceae bacterium]|nr:T9SS type A sorting domain-containing protein [Ignavibacteriaceae bacterium]
MKNLLSFFVTIIVFCNMLYAQKTVELAQLFLGITGVGGSEVVYHTIEAEGVVWEKSGNNYIISEDEDIYTSTMYSTGNFITYDPDARAPFSWKWMNQTGSFSPWGLGLYKITNSKVSGKYFFLDTRDNEFVQQDNPDVWFVYQSNTGKYRCVYKCDVPIENGSLVRVSEILGFTSKTDELENFWSNALVALNVNGHPRLIWGPYPSDTLTINNYKVYRKYGASSWQLLTTVSSNMYEYTDGSVTLSGQQAGTDVQYKVTAIYNTNNETSATNIITVNVQGGEIEKKGSSEGFALSEFRLDQNFPNPFNPATIISFSVAENSFVALKVYDVLGNEVSELVNEVKEPGNYTVSFDASNLSSGIYFYTLKANGSILTKKMLLAK